MRLSFERFQHRARSPSPSERAQRFQAAHRDKKAAAKAAAEAVEAQASLEEAPGREWTHSSQLD